MLLKDCIEIKNGKDYSHLSNGTIPVYGTGGIFKYVDKHLYDGTALLLPRKGSLNNVMYTENQKFWTVDTMFYAICKNKSINLKYLYYYLTLINIEKLDIGSTVPSMTTALYYSIDIPFPDRKTQDKIVAILSAIDNQLERNNKIVKRLQVLAQTIYSMIMCNPKTKIMLGDIASMYQPETITSDKFISNGQYPVYGAGGIIGFYNQYNHKESELMLSCRGVCGKIEMSLPYSFIIGNQMVIKVKDEKIKYFLYNYLLNADLSKVGTGSVQKQITRTNLEKIPIMLPPTNIIYQYADILSNIYDMKMNTIIETNNLDMLKKYLLPLLVTGQLSI